MKCFAVAVILTSAVLFAQSSGIQGVVTDQSAATVPDAQLTITHVATGVVTNAVTNERGFYSAPFLPTGPYRITAEKAGFSPVSRDNLQARGGSSCGSISL